MLLRKVILKCSYVLTMQGNCTVEKQLNQCPPAAGYTVQEEVMLLEKTIVVDTSIEKFKVIASIVPTSLLSEVHY